jgi:hypothetical protein
MQQEKNKTSKLNEYIAKKVQAEVNQQLLKLIPTITLSIYQQLSESINLSDVAKLNEDKRKPINSIGTRPTKPNAAPARATGPVVKLKTNNPILEQLINESPIDPNIADDGSVIVSEDYGKEPWERDYSDATWAKSAVTKNPYLVIAE